MLRKVLFGAAMTATLFGASMAQAQQVYWADSNRWGTEGQQAGNVFLYDNGTTSKVVEGTKVAGEVYWPLGIDVYGSSVYFTDDNGAIWESGLDGSNASMLISGVTSPQKIARAGDYLYWASYTGGTGGGALYRASLTDPANSVEKLYDVGSGYASGLAVDLTRGKLYWSEDGTGNVGMADLSDVAGTASVIAGANAPYALAVDEASGALYIAAFSSNTIEKFENGTKTTVLSGLSGPLGVDIADGYLYWGERTSSSIKRIALSGGSIETLVSGLDNAGYPFGIDAIGASDIPEPATLTLLGLGGLAALRRRRQA